MTFVIFDRTENSFAEQTSHFGFVGSVIDGFRFDYLSLTPIQNGFRSRQPNTDFSKIAFDLQIFSKRHGI
jgi:hypothetical protein